MFDDQDRCEWVNSCSCTGTPGSPRQRAVKRCVCVCLASLWKAIQLLIIVLTEVDGTFIFSVILAGSALTKSSSS